MKLFYKISYPLIILCLFIFLDARAFISDSLPNETLSLRKGMIEIEDLLEEIELSSGLLFSYEGSLFQSKDRIYLAHTSPTLSQILGVLKSQFNVDYQYKNGVIILSKQEKNFTIKGYVKDKETGESLIGASLYDPNTKFGTTTNRDGFFSLTLKRSTKSIKITFVGYQSYEMPVSRTQKDSILNVGLLSTTSAIDEVIVTGNESYLVENIQDTQMGSIKLSQKMIQNTPTLLGQSDLIKTYQLTPGVAMGTEGVATLHVRGGEMDENLFLLDGNPIYQVSHLGGLFSAFNPEAVRNSELLKGGIPARHGGRLSSVVDIQSKEGNMKKYQGSVNIGLTSGNVSVEGPIWKNRTSFHFSMRRSWLDVLTAPTIAIVNSLKGENGYKIKFNYNFQDVNARITHKFSERSKIYLSLYNGDDSFLMGGEDHILDGNGEPTTSNDITNRIRWGNTLATLGWTYIYNDKLFGKIAAVWTKYRSNMTYRFNEIRKPEQGVENIFFDEVRSKNGITDYGIRSSFNYIPNSKHHIRFGFDAMLHELNPSYSEAHTRVVEYGDTTLVKSVNASDLFWSREFVGYIEDEWSLNDAWKMNIGLRSALYNILKKTHFTIEPRFALRYKLSDETSFKASYTRMAQFMHVINNSYLNLPTDSWLPVTNRLNPLLSDIYSLGYYQSLPWGFAFSSEVYYKSMKNILDYKDGYSILPSSTYWEDKLAVGKGESYGLELMASRNIGKTTGWVGYTLSWSNRQFDDINDGKEFPARFDNRHKLNIVLTHKFNKKVDVTLGWTYSSGNRMTLPLEEYELEVGQPNEGSLPGSGVVSHFGSRNNYKLPAYHRLDVGLNVYKPKKKGRMGIWNVSLYNAYSRMNPFLVINTTVDKNGVTVPKFMTMSIFPIIPSFSYTYKF